MSKCLVDSLIPSDHTVLGIRPTTLRNTRGQMPRDYKVPASNFICCFWHCSLLGGGVLRFDPRIMYQLGNPVTFPMLVKDVPITTGSDAQNEVWEDVGDTFKRFICG